MTLRLTRAQRKALFAGEHPRIIWPKNREYSWPQEHKLSSKVSIQIVGCEKQDEGDYNLHYVVNDERPRLLRARTRSAGYEEGLREALTGAELVRASEASAYTHSPGASLRGTGEEVSRAEQDRFAKESGDPARAALRRYKAELKAVLERMKADPLLSGTRYSGDGSEFRFGERHFDKIMRKKAAKLAGQARREAA